MNSEEVSILNSANNLDRTRNITTLLIGVFVFLQALAGFAATPPIFHSGSVSPSSGNAGTSFQFEANWIDSDDPFIVNARVRYRKQGTSSWTTVSMGFISGGSTIKFRGARTIASSGTHEYQFAADASSTASSTGASSSWTSTRTFNIISTQPTPPIFSSGSVSPTSGDTGTSFQFEANWSDSDDPYIVNAQVRYRKQGTSSWITRSMSFISGSSIVKFRVSRTISTNGTHEYQFKADASKTASSTGVSSSWTSTRTFSVTDPAPTPPVFSSGSVSPTSGDAGTSFQFEANWSDSDDPYIVNAQVRYRKQGTSSWITRTMSFISGSSIVKFRVSRTISTSGTHEYQFKADASKTASSTGVSSSWTSTRTFSVTDPTPTPPIFSSGSVSPTSGDAGTSFQFEANWSDSDDPYIVNAQVRYRKQGTSSWITRSMSFISGSSIVKFRVSRTISTSGTHEYQFKADASKTASSTGVSSSWTSIRTFSVTDPTPTPPIFSSGSVSPTSGDAGTSFQFEANWSDSDDPYIVNAQVRYRKQGTSSWITRSMSFISGISTVKFSVSESISTNGTHEYQFKADASKTASSTGVSSSWTSIRTFSVTDPTPTPPIFSSGSVSPTSGDAGTSFQFEANWSDSDDPYIVNAQVRYRKQGTSSWITRSMSFISGISTVKFSVSESISTSGTHEYQFKADASKTASSTGVSSSWTSTSTFSVTESTPTPPVLQSGSINPNSGDAGSSFVFTSFWSDADDPFIVNARVRYKILGTSSWTTRSMGFVSGDSQKQFQISQALSNVGTYEFQFAADASKTASTTGVSSSWSATQTFNVTESQSTPPVFQSGSVNPTSGGAGSSFVFTSFWSDADDPFIVNARVRYRIQGTSSWTTQSMSFVPGGSQKQFQVSQVLSDVGTYEYEFAADASQTASTSGLSSNWSPLSAFNVISGSPSSNPSLAVERKVSTIQVDNQITLGFIAFDSDSDLDHIQIDWYDDGTGDTVKQASNGSTIFFGFTPITTGTFRWSARAWDVAGLGSNTVRGSVSVYQAPVTPEPPNTGLADEQDVSQSDPDECSAEKAKLEGKPVDLATGAQVESRTLLSVAGVLPIEFAINYNSLVLDVGLLGRGWQLSHGFASNIVEKENGDVVVNWSKNRFSTFQKTNSEYHPLDFGCRLDTLTLEQDGTFKLNRRNRLTYIFDRNNILKRIENSKGQGLNYIFSNDNKLVTVSEPISGVFLNYSYNAEGFIQTVTDPENNRVEMEYQSQNLVRIVRADGSTDEYSYNNLGQIETRTLDGILIEQNTHDEHGRTVTQDDSDNTNQVANYSYQVQDNQIHSTYIDRNGKQSTYIHSEDYQLLQSIDALGDTRSYTYDANGKRKTAVDAKGNLTTFSHDDKGDLIRVDFADNTSELREYDNQRNLTSVTDQAGNVESYEYDSSNNLIRLVNREGDATVYTYDDNGLPLTETTPEGNTTSYGYLNGRLILITNPEGNSRTLSYDAAGRLIGETDFAGNSVSYQLDPMGRIIQEMDALNRVKSWTYNARGQVLVFTDAKGLQTNYEYTGEGYLDKKILPDGTFWLYGYDGEGREISIRNPRGKTTTFERDSSGRVIRTIDALGNIYSTQYDKNGNIELSRTPLGSQTKTTYDALNRPASVQDILGNTISYRYDSRSNVSETIDAEEKKTLFEYDKLNNAIKITDPALKVSSETFDTEEETQSVVDPNNNARLLTRDKNARVITEATADGILVRYEYDPRGLISKEINGRAQETSFTYDAAGQLVGKTDEVGSTIYNYDANGNLLGVSENGVESSRTYDTLNRVISYDEDTNEVGVITYGYDASSNLTSLQYPSINTGTNNTISYTYDDRDYLTEVAGIGVSASYELDAKGRLVKTTRGNGTVELRRYDATDRLTQVKDTDSTGAIIIQYDYSYDKNGKLAGTKSLPSPNSPPIELMRDLSMGYSTSNKLHNQDYSKSGESNAGELFDSDADGNILDLNGQEFALSTSREKTIFRPNEDSSQPPVLDQSYDDVLTYNVRNQLIAAGDYSYQYHPEGYRIALINNQENDVQVVNYLVNPEASLSQVLRETFSNGESYDFVYGRGLVAQKDQGGSIYYFHYDYRGSIVAVSDSSGVVVARFGYLPEGQRYTFSGSLKTPFGYNARDGVMTDPNGLIYMRARYYSPDQKRFINKDPLRGQIGDIGSLNRYAYVGGDPVNFVDPTGQALALLFAPPTWPAWTAATTEAVALTATVLVTCAAAYNGINGYLSGSNDNSNKVQQQTSAVGSTSPPSGPNCDPKTDLFCLRKDTTKKNSTQNTETSITQKEFEMNLLNDGYRKTLSQDGVVNIFTKSGQSLSYTTRNFSSSKGPTAEVIKTVFGIRQVVQKIRLVP